MKPLRSGQVLLADKAYDIDAIHADGAVRGMRVNIPLMAYRKTAIPFDKTLNCAGNTIERLVNKIKKYRRFATQYDKHTDSFMGGTILAAIRITIRCSESAVWNSTVPGHYGRTEYFQTSETVRKRKSCLAISGECMDWIRCNMPPIAGLRVISNPGTPSRGSKKWQRIFTREFQRKRPGILEF